MTVRPDMHVGDWGTTFIMTVNNRSTNKALSLQGTLTRVLLFQSPQDGTETLAVSADIATPPGTDGKLKYVFQEGDIDFPGTWQVQGLVQTPDGQWHTDIETFEVGENIPEPSS
jgi:hypothetical protein